MHTRRVITKSESQPHSLVLPSRDSVRNNPFLGLTTQISPKLRPACPNVRSVLTPPATLGFEKFKPLRRQMTTANIKLKPIKIVRAPRLLSTRLPKPVSPSSPRPVRTPSFYQETGILPSIKCRSISLKKPSLRLNRPTSLKTLTKPEVACSFGTLSLKRVQML